MQGWICLHREIVDKAIWTESTPEQKAILITLLILANHKEKEWEWQGEKYKAKAGQFVTSLKSIADKSGKGVSIQNVRTAIARFEKYEFLTSESTNKNRLITLVNWDLYQVQENNQQANQQAPNKQLTTNNNDNNDNNKKNTSKIDEDFEKLWKLYPKKSLKKDALIAYKKALKKGVDNVTIQNGIVAYKKLLAINDWQKPMDGGRWFAKERWGDDYSLTNGIGTSQSKPKTARELQEEREREWSKQ